MTQFRILVTGSRGWKDTAAVHVALDALVGPAIRSGFGGITVVHGGAKGADTSAHLWTVDRKRLGWPVVVEVHAADWRKYGKGAGMRRNAEMVRLGADVCLAFLADCELDRCRKPKPHPTHGAADCADLAEGAAIHTERIVPRPAGGA